MQKRPMRTGRQTMLALAAISAIGCATAPPETITIDSACTWVTQPAYTCEDINTASDTLIDWLIDHVDNTHDICGLPRPICKD